MRKEFSIFCTFAYNSVHLIREFKRSKESPGRTTPYSCHGDPFHGLSMAYDVY